MYKVKVNDKKTISIDLVNDGYQVDGQDVAFDCIPTDEHRYHLLVNNKSFEAKLLDIDVNKKIVRMQLEGREFNLEVADNFDLLLVKMGIDKGAQKKVSALVAPMPGLVLSLAVKEGDSVEIGDPLLVLEAMKMENVLPSPTQGIIKQVHVTAGSKVDKNEVCVSFE